MWSKLAAPALMTRFFLQVSGESRVTTGGETSASFKELSVFPWRANFASKYPGKERRKKERNVEERGRTWRNVERASIRRRTQLRSARYLFEGKVLARLYRISTNSPMILLFFHGTQGPIPRIKRKSAPRAAGLLTSPRNCLLAQIGLFGVEFPSSNPIYVEVDNEEKLRAFPPLDRFRWILRSGMSDCEKYRNHLPPLSWKGKCLFLSHSLSPRRSNKF